LKSGLVEKKYRLVLFWQERTTEMKTAKQVNHVNPEIQGNHTCITLEKRRGVTIVTLRGWIPVIGSIILVYLLYR
jgi:hypothetical protein